jgi:hypothetical protein
MFYLLLHFFRESFVLPNSLQNNGTTEHQVESFIRKKLESLLKESQIRDKEDPDSFTVRALLKATHEGLNAHLKQVCNSPCTSHLVSNHLLFLEMLLHTSISPLILLEK